MNYASDIDEREAIIEAKNGLESLAKTSSSAQIDGIGKEIKKLESVNRELENAMNKEEMQRQGLMIISKVEKRFSEAHLHVEQGWNSYAKR